ncbi:hypothetical protein F4779DRAFT_573047 [Xylariaceae sp. FL0662B]|nr:hypothetical protein F4779DRAFT_573047 [Xylariaceae sp. FL0662B]
MSWYTAWVAVGAPSMVLPHTARFTQEQCQAGTYPKWRTFEYSGIPVVDAGKMPQGPLTIDSLFRNELNRVRKASGGEAYRDRSPLGSNQPQPRCQRCNEAGHPTDTCPHSGGTCYCRPDPEHSWLDCPVRCRRCYLDKKAGNDVDDNHTAVKCPMWCVWCATPKTPYHTGTECKRQSCFDQTSCVDGFMSQPREHLSQDCRYLLCTNNVCGLQDRICRFHCAMCGWEEEEFGVVLREQEPRWRHICAWTRLWVYDEESGLHFWMLSCNKDPTHRRVTAEKLTDIRATSFRAIQREISTGKANSALPHPALRERPECRECWEARYPGTDYSNQSVPRSSP